MMQLVGSFEVFSGAEPDTSVTGEGRNSSNDSLHLLHFIIFMGFYFGEGTGALQVIKCL